VSDEGTRRAAPVLLAGVAVVAAIGFLTGTQVPAEPRGYSPVADGDRDGHLRTAPAQRDMEAARYADRRAGQLAALERMASAEGDGADASGLNSRDPAAYAGAIAQRQTNRAYDGAPPTVPHAVDQHGAPACLACHERGMAVEGRVAPMMSHERYESCVQCHTTSETPFAPSVRLPHAVSEVNSFVGRREPEHGTRAWAGAPPTMPHRTFMREVCASCHGARAEGLLPGHPWRESCSQCHGPSGTLDQQPRGTTAPLQGLRVVAP
jgi:cytochrome c-type protein NapB